MPNAAVVVKMRVSGGEPVVEEVFTGVYIEATSSPKTDLDLPGRVDWENRLPLLDLHSLAAARATTCTPGPDPRWSGY